MTSTASSRSCALGSTRTKVAPVCLLVATSACCWSAISKALTLSAPLPGVRRTVCAPRVSRAGVAGGAAGSFDHLAHASLDRPRNARAVFTWMLQRLADAGLVKGKTVGIDATTLEANAALRSIVRRDTGESYQDFLTKLAQASGSETPTRAEERRVGKECRSRGSTDASNKNRRETDKDETAGET